MFTIAAKGTYPKFTAPPRPSLLARAIKSWQSSQITDGELERALQRGEVEVIAELVAAGCEVVWEGQLRWDSPAYLLGSLKGVVPWVNSLIGEKLPVETEGESPNGNSIPGDPSESNGHHLQRATQVKVKVVDRLSWQRPILVETYRFLSERVPVDLRPVLTGPVSLAQLCDDGYYGEDIYGRIVDIAKALNRELQGLEAIGARQILIEEPLLLSGDLEPTQLAEITGILTSGVASSLFLSASNDITTDIALLEQLPFKGFCIDPHGLDPVALPELIACFTAKEAIIELGVINGRKPHIEDPAAICEIIATWGRAYPPDNIWVSSTGGLGGLTREVAYLKLQSLAKGADLARRELAKDE